MYFFCRDLKRKMIIFQMGYNFAKFKRKYIFFTLLLLIFVIFYNFFHWFEMVMISNFISTSTTSTTHATTSTKQTNVVSNNEVFHFYEKIHDKQSILDFLETINHPIQQVYIMLVLILVKTNQQLERIYFLNNSYYHMDLVRKDIQLNIKYKL